MGWTISNSGTNQQIFKVVVSTKKESRTIRLGGGKSTLLSDYEYASVKSYIGQIAALSAVENNVNKDALLALAAKLDTNDGLTFQDLTAMIEAIVHGG